jgi:NADPH-dependent glutamate synthase beta subunit-like oxidoreductase
VPWQEYAWRRLTEANPLPSVMGRVCPAPCESGCNRNQVEDFVGINSVEHFLGEWAIEKKLRSRSPRSAPARPSPSSAAARPACRRPTSWRARATVTIFDERAELGGMMRYGIPGFRTPRPVLDAEIQRILDLGVTTRMNCRIGTDITLDQIKADFDAVFLGLGAQGGRPLPVEGADAPNVVTATAFLKAFNDGRLQHVGKRVVVVGGGDTSIDVATVARRLGHIDQVHESDRPENAIAGYAAHDAATLSARQGAEVTLTSVFAIDKMQASKHEVEHALSEGIAIRGGWRRSAWCATRAAAPRRCA